MCFCTHKNSTQTATYNITARCTFVYTKVLLTSLLLKLITLFVAIKKLKFFGNFFFNSIGIQYI